jgi:ABC-type multidrug transport system fused ATPase/permease subunit
MKKAISKKIILPYLFVAVIFSALFFLANGAKADPAACSGDTVAGVCFPSDTGLSNASVSDILSTFLNWLLGIFTAIAIMAFVISGIQYLVSAGDEGIIEKAKTNMKWSIVGIVVGLSGFLLLQAVSTLLNGTSSQF